MKYECSSCEESSHYKCTSDKLKIILTAEPLEGAKNRKLQDSKDKLHVDMTCVPNGMRFAMFHALLADYSGIMKDKACDILVLGFLPDLIEGYPVGPIVRDIRYFKKLITGLNPENTIAFCTNYLPPSCSVLPGDPAQFKNNKNITNNIVFLNSMIMDINEEEFDAFTCHAPRFHTWGLRTHTNAQVELAGWHRNVLETKGGHNYSQWWNADPNARFLQLNLAAKVYKACVKYFEAMGNISDKPKDDRKVVTLDETEYNKFQTGKDSENAPDPSLNNSIDQEIQSFDDLCEAEPAESSPTEKSTQDPQPGPSTEDLRHKVDKLTAKRKANSKKQLPILHKTQDKSPAKKAKPQDPAMPTIQEKDESKEAGKKENLMEKPDNISWPNRQK